MTTAALPSRSTEPIIIAGRRFQQATGTTTVDQDAYVMKRYRASGLAAIVQAFDPTTDDLNALSERLLWEALDSGAMYEILAGILVEEGVTWSRAVAATTAAFLRGLTDSADKQVVYHRMTDVLYDFLLIAAVSNPTSLKSSLRGQPLPPTTPPASPLNGEIVAATENAATASLGDPEE